MPARSYLLRVYCAPPRIPDEVHDSQTAAIESAREHLKNREAFAEVNWLWNMLLVWRAYKRPDGTYHEDRPNREPGSDDDA